MSHEQMYYDIKYVQKRGKAIWSLFASVGKTFPVQPIAFIETELESIKISPFVFGIWHSKIGFIICPCYFRFIVFVIIFKSFEHKSIYHNLNWFGSRTKRKKAHSEERNCIYYVFQDLSLDINRARIKKWN